MACKKVLDAAKGYYDRRSKTFKVAKQAVDKANRALTMGPIAFDEILETSLIIQRVEISDFRQR